MTCAYDSLFVHFVNFFRRDHHMSIKNLAVCLLNVSEGQNKKIIEAVASAAANANDGFSSGT